MISKYLGILAAAVAITVVAIFVAKQWQESVQRAAIAEERRERMADAIDLIRETDKKLDVVRKATDADLCRELGGQTIDGVDKEIGILEVPKQKDVEGDGASQP